MELPGSQTERNLVMAFVGESAARNRYTYFASQARNDGYIQISQIFEETASQEKEHAKLHLKALAGLGDTLANLKAAAGGEHEEWTAMYPRMAQEARAEGFTDLGRIFDGLAKIEKEHEARYQALLASLTQGTVFAKKEKTRWVCRNCGFTYEGTKALDKCPICNHPQAYFEIAATNY